MLHWVLASFTTLLVFATPALICMRDASGGGTTICSIWVDFYSPQALTTNNFTVVSLNGYACKYNVFPQ